jgi:hypothetical protein
LCGAVLHQPEQARDEGQGRTLRQVKTITKTSTTSNRNSAPATPWAKGNRGQHDGYGAAQPRPGEKGLMS